MQNTTTVHFKRSATPIIGIMAVITAFLAASPLFFNASRQLSPQQKSIITEKALSQPVYKEIARASHLLVAGDADGAGAILDNQRMEPLIITSGGYSEGVMAEDSPTTLLMRLSRGMRDEAIRRAKTRKTDEALLWVARLHSLANQALRSNSPSYDALQTAYYMESNAYRAEELIWQQFGNKKRATSVAAQGHRLDRLWSQEVLPQICAGRKQECTMTVDAEKAHKPVSTVSMENREETHARALVRTLTAKLRV